MLPTFTLGLVLGAIALRAGSILPSALAHCINNAMAIVVHRQASEPLSRGLAEHLHLALAGFGALFVVGTAVAVTRTRARRATPVAAPAGPERSAP